jgi:hypothetical protein
LWDVLSLYLIFLGQEERSRVCSPSSLSGSNFSKETQHPLFCFFGGVANENIKMPMFNDIGPMRFEYVYFGLFWSIPDVVFQKNGVEK